MVQKKAKQISAGQLGFMLSAYIGGSALMLNVFGRYFGA